MQTVHLKGLDKAIQKYYGMRRISALAPAHLLAEASNLSGFNGYAPLKTINWQSHVVFVTDLPSSSQQQHQQQQHTISLIAAVHFFCHSDEEVLTAYYCSALMLRSCPCSFIGRWLIYCSGSALDLLCVRSALCSICSMLNLLWMCSGSDLCWICSTCCAHAPNHVLTAGPFIGCWLIYCSGSALDLLCVWICSVFESALY
jgi:hypothetical protein